MDVSGSFVYKHVYVNDMLEYQKDVNQISFSHRFKMFNVHVTMSNLIRTMHAKSCI